MSISAQQRTVWWSWTDEGAPVSYYAPMKQAMRQLLTELDKLDHVEGFGDSVHAKPAAAPPVNPTASLSLPSTPQPAPILPPSHAQAAPVTSTGDALAGALNNLADAIRSAGQPRKRGRPPKPKPPVVAPAP